MSLPIQWQGDDCFTHMLVVGATRSGKTATILKPMIYQLLLQKKRGVPLGLSVVEPKGDVAQMVNDMCVEMDIPVTHVDPIKPNSARFNPMEGEINAVAEATVVVLKGLFGKQDAFFATVQELSARNVTKLLKELHGDQIDIIDVMNTLRDSEELKRKVAELRAKQGNSDLVHFFESELLGSMADRYRQFVIGLRAQLENIVSNNALRHIMTGKSNIDIDEHFEKGGVLAVNTALGMLRKSGDAFGQFIIMHLQNGTFRRPGTERTRVPHFLIVDEYSRYINPDVEIFLSLAAEYRVAGIFATQSLGQLEVESGTIGAKAMKKAILTSCRNKIAFGGLSSEDAKEFAEEFGKDKVIMRQSTYKNRILVPRLFPDSYRDTEMEEYRFDFSDIMDGLPRFHFIHKLLQDGTPQKPSIAKGSFVPRNWKELREWETKGGLSLFGLFKDKLTQSSDKAEDTANLVEATEERSLKFEEELKEKPKPDLSHLGLTETVEGGEAVPEQEYHEPDKLITHQDTENHSDTRAVENEIDFESESVKQDKDAFINTKSMNTAKFNHKKTNASVEQNKVVSNRKESRNESQKEKVSLPTGSDFWN